MPRPFFSAFCSLTIPILLLCAYTLWNKRSRRELPHWRNGAGLVSIALIFVSWSIQLFDWAFFLIRINWQDYPSLDWYSGSIEIYLLPLAPLLALAFKGLPRLQVLTAGMLVWALAASLTYS